MGSDALSHVVQPDDLDAEVRAFLALPDVLVGSLQTRMVTFRDTEDATLPPAATMDASRALSRTPVKPQPVRPWTCP